MTEVINEMNGELKINDICMKRHEINSEITNDIDKYERSQKELTKVIDEFSKYMDMENRMMDSICL